MIGRLLRSPTAIFLLLASPCAISGDATVGPSNCNEAGFDAALAVVDGGGGGTIRFDCGTTTIPFTYYKQVAHAVTIDGAGRITFDGGNTCAFFQVYASANLTLRGLTLQHGVFNGAHALENFGTLTLDKVHVSANVSTETPVMNHGVLRVRSSTFTNNRADSAGTAGDGGAIANQSGTLDIRQSTFSNNHAGRYGGAIYSDSDATIDNSTFSLNSAEGGGALYRTGSGGSQVTYASIVDNTAEFGAGLYVEGSSSASLTLSRSIVSANKTSAFAGANCDGVFASGGYNLSNDGTCGGVFTQPTDALNRNLPLGPLQDNGGPTWTRLPLDDNDAIDYVPASACAGNVDQRNYLRPAHNACDAGAVELDAADDIIFADGFD